MSFCVPKIRVAWCAIFVLFGAMACAPKSSAQPAEQSKGATVQSEVPLTSLDVTRAVQMWGRPRKDGAASGKPMRIAGKVYEKGVGMHAIGKLHVRLMGRAERFVASVGVDDGERQGSVEFKLIGDGKALWSSGVMRAGEPTKPVSVNLAGVQFLTLEVGDAGNGISGDHALWVDARFENVRGVIRAVERLPQDQQKIIPGAGWRDTNGNLIQAHGGGILQHNGKFYWYGEDRSEGYVAIGTSGYVSEDLVNWKHLGVVLPKNTYDEKWKALTINERPKVIYNPKTKKFVMWFHYDRSSYWDSQAGVAIADKPEGPFKFLGMHRPIEKSTYRDMNLFVDDDGKAYAIAAGEENYTMHIFRLNEEWTGPEQPMVEGKTWIRTLIRAHREAPAPFKHNGKYYMITSAATGWNPNRGNYAIADSMLGEWKIVGDPFVGPGSEITFGSQSTYVLPVPGKSGHFIYMGDRWTPSLLADARYVWLPFEMNKDGTFKIHWRENWELKDAGLPAPRKVDRPAEPDLAPAQPAEFGDGKMNYRLPDTVDLWPLDKRKQIIDAMNSAVAVFNEAGEFPRTMVAHYSPGLGKSVGELKGPIRFSGEITPRVALQEIGRALGVGSHADWGKFIDNGKWTGKEAIAQLREFDGSDAVLYADENGFKPYGLASDREATPENQRRYVKLVSALRRDLGIPLHEPIKGMIGLGTWATQAEFKDIRVTKGNDVLYSSDFSSGLDGWKTRRGKWEANDGVLRQSGNDQNARATFGDPNWSDYTITLKARKLSGEEGFLIRFGLADEQTRSHLNLGGSNNTQHVLDVPEMEDKPIAGQIETGRWYDVRIELSGHKVKCYLDGQLVQEGTR